VAGVRIQGSGFRVQGVRCGWVVGGWVARVLAVALKLGPDLRIDPHPLSSEDGTYNTVKVQFWPGLSDESPENVLRCSLVARLRYLGASSSSVLTSNLLKRDQLLTTHHSPSTENRDPLQTS